MAYLIGTDEAGYGPNLGPLLVSATVWRVPDTECELYKELKSVVRDGAVIDKQTSDRIAIADSKLLYKPKGGLKGLELPLFAAMDGAFPGSNCRSWRECWRLLTQHECDEIDQLPWYRDFERSLPIDAEVAQVSDFSMRLTECLANKSIELKTIRSVPVFPQRFNQLVDQFDSKGAALSTVTLDLVAQLVAELDANHEEPIRIECDKHGGRNSYASFLQPRFEDRLVRVECESRPVSSYEIGTSDRPMSISFRSQGEAFLPAALASIASKYLRELAMIAFNDFWSRRISNLRPTAGYPVDAKRFRVDVASTQRELKIHDDQFWRKR